MGVLEVMKQDQQDLKDHVLNKLEAQDQKLELALTSGRVVQLPQSDQMTSQGQAAGSVNTAVSVGDNNFITP